MFQGGLTKVINGYFRFIRFVFGRNRAIYVYFMCNNFFGCEFQGVFWSLRPIFLVC